MTIILRQHIFGSVKIDCIRMYSLLRDTNIYHVESVIEMWAKLKKELTLLTADYGEFSLLLLLLAKHVISTKKVGFVCFSHQTSEENKHMQ